jgi:hypothetical protein
MEFRRATIRIASNYVRLAASVILGLYLYRVLTDALGDKAVGLVFLLTSTVGIAAIVEEATSWSMIRELGASHHGGDDAAFRSMFNSAVALSVGLATLILIVFGVLLGCLPLMNIEPALQAAAWWFVIAKAIETAKFVFLSPQFNMYLVTERMVAYNFWLTMRRMTTFAAALSLIWLNAGGDPARGLILFGWLSCALMVAATIVAVIIIMVQDRRLIPSLRFASRSGIRSLLGISGWNLSVLGSQAFVLPLGAIIMNVAFDLKLNQVFGYATTLSGYARMLASGMTVGLDAVAARISTAHAAGDLRSLLRTSTMLHAVAVFPAVVGIGILAQPMLQLWIASKIQVDPASTIAAAATLTRILLIGFAGLLFCDCWTRVLFGAGHVRRYAPIMVIGNFAAPVVAIALLFLIPGGARYTAVAWAFTIIHTGFFMAFIPRRVASALDVTYWEVISPLARPLMVALVCAPIVWLFLSQVSTWSMKLLALAALAYGSAYGLLTWLFVLKAEERWRLISAAKARLPMFRPG